MKFKKIFILLLAIPFLFISGNVYANDDKTTEPVDQFFGKFVKNIKESSFFTDYKDMNENDYETFIENDQNTLAIVGRYKGQNQYILYYEYDEKTGILTYAVTDLERKTDRNNLEKHIPAALLWNMYVVEAVGGKETLENYKTNDACSMTLEKNGIELLTEDMGGDKTSYFQGYKATYDTIYAVMKIDLKNGIRLTNGNSVNKVTDFKIEKDTGEKNPSTGVTSTLVLLSILGITAGTIYVSKKQIKKLKETEE